MAQEWPLAASERWKVEQDSRPGMVWNRHIIRADGTARRVAFAMAHSAGHDDAGDEARATLCASAPALLAALEALIEDAQPDNWDDGDDLGLSDAWRGALRVVLEAKGLPVPAYLRPAGASRDG